MLHLDGEGLLPGLRMIYGGMAMCPIGDRCDICRELATKVVHWPAWAAKLCDDHANIRISRSTEDGNSPTMVMNLPKYEESSC